MEPVSGTTEARSETAEQRKITLGLLPGLDENGHDGATPRYKTIQRMAQEAEDAGLDTFWLADHFFYEEAPDKPRVGQWEAFTFLSALAAATSRIQLGPMVAATSFRNPALLAKMADSLDEISDGRFILGIGAGWHQPEYDAFGYPFDHRVARFEEALQVIKPLLREGKVDFTGQYYSARNCTLNPRGPTSGWSPYPHRRAPATHAASGRALRRRLEHGLAREARGRGRALGADARDLRRGGARSGDAGADGWA